MPNQTDRLRTDLPQDIGGSTEEALAELTEKQRGFVLSFARQGNASQAARDGGYSHRIASQQATKLLRKPSIQKCLSLLRRDLVESESISPGEVVARLRAHAMTSPVDLLARRKHWLYEEDGSPVLDHETGEHRWQWVYRYKDPEELSPNQKAMVSSINLNTRHMRDGSIRQTIEYKTVDQSRALADLARVLGMNQDNVRHEHSGTVEHKVKGVFEFIAQNPSHSDTTARIAQSATGRRRPLVIEHE